ncbi:MAG: HEAT repeat domain-containing protein [Ignavibacteria bacterium]|nr:HEAT repeat domain-containing protein [Ignavibacteria bacterium]
MPFLAEKLATESPRERLALDAILFKLYDKDTLEVEKLLLDSLESPTFETIALSASILSRKKVDSALPIFLMMLSDNQWRKRALAAQQIGELGDKSAAGNLAELLKDSHPSVRARSAYSLGQLLPDSISEYLTPAFVDEAQIVRNSAIQSLKRQKMFTVEMITKIFSDSTPVKTRLELAPIFQTIENTFDTTDSKLVANIVVVLKTQPQSLRGVLYQTLGLRDNPIWKKSLVECRKTETVRELILKLPEKQDKKKKKKPAIPTSAD